MDRGQQFARADIFRIAAHDHIEILARFFEVTQAVVRQSRHHDQLFAPRNPGDGQRVDLLGHLAKRPRHRWLIIAPTGEQG